MLDKVGYWLDLCNENLITAKWLIQGEKALKAVVANVSDETPPKIHDLHKLAKLGSIDKELSEEQRTFINNIGPYQLEARYPEVKERIAQTLTPGICEQYLKETEGFLCWIKQRLER
jgi:HEPN domain-containing protein